MKKQFEQFRPKGFTGSGDRFLYPLIIELSKEIYKLEKSYSYNTLKLDESQNFRMSNLLIEFAEDLHNDIGLWSSIEHYNNLMFNTPLPLFVPENTEINGCFDKNRIKFFFYTIFVEFDDNLIFSPQHHDLEVLATGVSLFLTQKFKSVPKFSGVKLFLNQHNDYGWDFKRKLVWIGLNSYLFRYSCYRYAQEKNDGKIEIAIAIIDDFICQENTIWSGLGVIDILAKALELPEKIEADVRSWYERFISYYRVVSLKNKILELENLINNEKYLIQTDDDANIFQPGEVVLGGLVPFGDYYYWSGSQRKLGKLDDNTILELKNNFVRKSTRIVYRYDKKLLAKAYDSVKGHYDDFKAFFKDDLVIFKDGKSMKLALETKDQQKNDVLSKIGLNLLFNKNKIKDPSPKMNLSNDILESKNGIGLYFNPDEGMEIMLFFDDLNKGFSKKGENLTPDEKETIREFISSRAISPNFVQKMIAKNGDSSIAVSFNIHKDVKCTNYLLHQYKGHFYRNKYPEISFKID